MRAAPLLLAPLLLALLPPAALAEDADALARRVSAYAGDPTALTELAFSFVVSDGETEKARRRHVWRPREGRLTVTAGELSVSFTGLSGADPTPWAKEPAAHQEQLRSVAPEASPEDAAKAWGFWINDGYWLLMPSKVLDPGVRRSVEDGRLVLRFDGVGLTPGDTYRLSIDAEGRVTAWDFELQSGRKGSFRWEGWEARGPLNLSLLRPAAEGGFRIAFEDVEFSP